MCIIISVIMTACVCSSTDAEHDQIVGNLTVRSRARDMAGMVRPRYPDSFVIRLSDDAHHPALVASRVTEYDTGMEDNMFVKRVDLI
jgi:hypothetical protein